jgi:hypothetical protein
MKAIFIFALILVAATSYTLWDNWHNNPPPSKWVPTPSGTKSSQSSLSGWTRNLPSNPHPSGQFSDFTQIYSQYMWWNNSNVNSLVFCGPKHYIFNVSHCKKDPYYWSPSDPTYCIPNYYNSGIYPSLCSGSSCCYENSGLPTTFEKNFSSIDTYSPPLL